MNRFYFLVRFSQKGVEKAAGKKVPGLAPMSVCIVGMHIKEGRTTEMIRPVYCEGSAIFRGSALIQLPHGGSGNA